MEYHEIHNFIHQEKLRNLSSTPSGIEVEDFDDSSDSSLDTPLDRHLRRTHHHTRHYYQASASMKKEQSWWPFMSTKAEELPLHPHDTVTSRKNRIKRPRPFFRARSTDRSIHTRRLTVSKRAKIRRQLGSLWKRRQQQQRSPRAPAIKTYQAAQSPDPPATIISQSILIDQIIRRIHTLQCLVDIQVQCIEDHQRDVGFYTDRLDQLREDVMYLYRKVLEVLTTVETQMDPIHDQIQRTVTSLTQLHRSHGAIVAGFMALAQRTRTSLGSSIAHVATAQLQIARWDTITFWTWLVFGIVLVSFFIWWMITFTGWAATLVSLALLFWLIYDTS